MSKKMKDIVYDTLIVLSKKSDNVSAIDISEYLKISRQNSSHYLTRLYEDGLVTKTSGKPVYWMPLKKENEPSYFFSSIIGYNGSLSKEIHQCVAAVIYPPKGLNLLITGETGVGKSFLAKNIYEFAISQKMIKNDSPFVILNCADYADNPQLLSSILFGYKKGSYTGAVEDTDGLLKKANGGYLFLDEVHRLSNENQEKLFLFMDSGRYRLFGDSGDWQTSDVRLLLATTEKKENFLLETFLRRIELNIHLSSFVEKPIKEKIELIIFFLKN